MPSTIALDWVDWLMMAAGVWFLAVTVLCAYFIARGWRVRAGKERTVANTTSTDTLSNEKI